MGGWWCVLGCGIHFEVTIHYIHMWVIFISQLTIAGHRGEVISIYTIKSISDEGKRHVFYFLNLILLLGRLKSFEDNIRVLTSSCID